jgi:probable rRNA maturation factor
MLIRFFSEEIDFKLPNPRKTSHWVKFTAEKERVSVNSIQFIFCSDGYLAEINKDYLNHNELTDIITFEYPGQGAEGTSDVFISIERVKENASNLDIPFEEELHRVIIHGVLHLAGYKDKTKAEKARMREKEEAYLSLRSKTKTFHVKPKG